MSLIAIKSGMQGAHKNFTIDAFITFYFNGYFTY